MLYIIKQTKELFEYKQLVFGRIQAVKNSDGQTPAQLNYYEATLSSQFLIVNTETELTQVLKVFGVMPGKWCALQRSDLKAYLKSAGITGLQSQQLA